ncbi:hypothetical protein OHV05_10845 [Kitasatospora sp. NBC_00070]|uniref:hypothetical protein n=1 Tax=Kitasatospora sp. NBC_00070 TaxID=2975962 RepID=UPI00324B8905
MIIRPGVAAARRHPGAEPAGVTGVRGRGVLVAVGCLVLGIVGSGGGEVARAAVVAGTQRGGEARDALRLSVRTNATEGTAVRVRAGEQVLRSYRIVNRAEYGLTAVISDQQVPGGQVRCGQGGQGGQGATVAVPPLGTVECSVRFVAGAGPQETTVTVDGAAPDGLPGAVATTRVGYVGIASGLDLRAVGPPAGLGVTRRPGSVEARPVRLVQVAPAAGAVELHFQVEALGEVPVSGTKVASGVPGAGTVSCAWLSGDGLLVPGHPVECVVSGTARPGPQTGVVQGEGYAEDGAIGEDGQRLAARRLTGEAAGGYDGASGQGGGAGGSGGGGGGGGGGGTGHGGGTGAGTGGSGGGSQGGASVGGGAGGGMATAGAGPTGVNPVGGQAASSDGLAVGQAVSGLVVPYRPGLGPLPGLGSPFRVPVAGTGQPGSPGPGADAVGVPAPGKSGGAAAAMGAAAAEPGAMAGAGAGAEAPLGHEVAAEAPGSDGRFDPDDNEPWEMDEVMVLLLAMLLPVLCALAAAFAARGRGGRG